MIARYQSIKNGIFQFFWDQRMSTSLGVKYPPGDKSDLTTSSRMVSPNKFFAVCVCSSLIVRMPIMKTSLQNQTVFSRTIDPLAYDGRNH